MRCALIVLLLTGCSIVRPVWMGDEGVSEMCESTGVYDFTHEGVTKQFTVILMDWRDVQDFCTNLTGRPAKACISGGYFIYAPEGMFCEKSMAHELSHGFGMHFVDRPVIHDGSMSRH